MLANLITTASLSDSIVECYSSPCCFFIRQCNSLIKHHFKDCDLFPTACPYSYLTTHLSLPHNCLTSPPPQLRETDSDLGRLGRLLSGMLHRAVQNRVLLMLVAAVLLAAVGYAVYALIVR